MERLTKLRQEIEHLDREILHLVSKRLDLAREIGRLKKNLGAPLRDWEQEKVVIERATEFAMHEGLHSPIAKSLMQFLMKESRLQQEQIHYSSYSGDKEDILIVGGLGEMGNWFAHFFANQGHNVAIYDISGISSEFTSYTSLQKGLANASCTLIAVSLEAVPEVIDEITGYGYTGIVFDVASFKSFLKTAIDAALKKGISYTSIHPMFGPGTSTLSDKTLCFIDCGCKGANLKVHSFFAETAVNVVNLSLDEHDRIVSYILGLSHIINVIFSEILVDSRFPFARLQKIGSTTFNSQMETTRSVIQEKADLYYAIQRLNPYRDELYSQLTKITEKITRIVEKGERENFLILMQEGRDWLER